MLDVGLALAGEEGERVLESRKQLCIDHLPWDEGFRASRVSGAILA
jgi:hypothetical protein